MTPTTTQGRVIAAALNADVPVLLWGAPGTGKTAAIHSLADAANAHLEVLIGSTLDPADVGGLPVPSDGSLAVMPPAWATRLRRALDSRSEAWLLLDELSCAPPSVQAALLRVVNERHVAELSLRGMRVLAAANPSDSAVDGGWLGPATANRWCHVNWAVDVGEWCVGEMTGWGQTRSRRHRESASLIVSWIRHRPTLLCALPQNAEMRERGWPSPRSWSASARALAALDSSTPQLASQLPEAMMLLTGLVGSGPAGEFVTWAGALDLPDPEALLTGKAKLPSRGDQALAALDAMIVLAIETERETDAWRVLARARRDLALGAAIALRRAAPGCVPEEALSLGDAIIGAEKGL